MKALNPVTEVQAFVARFPTQGAAAKALGVSQAYLSDIVNGRRDVSSAIMEKLGLKQIVVKA